MFKLEDDLRKARWLKGGIIVRKKKSDRNRLEARSCTTRWVTHLGSNSWADNVSSGSTDVLIAHNSRSELSLGFRERSSRAAVQTADL